ncbi:MAG: glycosyltransferase family 2 protein, partial [Roseobacter sp.]
HVHPRSPPCPDLLPRGTLMAGRVIERHLLGQQGRDIVLVDAVTHDNAGHPCARLFFDGLVKATEIAAPPGATHLDKQTTNGASIHSYALDTAHLHPFTLNGNSTQIVPATAEPEILAGKNCFVALRNGETADIVLDWLAFHHSAHALEGVVLLDRAPIDPKRTFAQQIQTGLAALSLPVDVILVTSPLPLGRTDLPPQAHPFCAPDAPGKDRMTLPQPSPWDSPLAVLSIYEMLRYRFLAQARAVANIEVHDIIPLDTQTVFDRACASETGVILLNGHHCYPWRVRNEAPVHFGDHICRQFDATGLRRRWCVAPARLPKGAVWRLVRIGNARAEDTQPYEFFRHMGLRHPDIPVSKIVPKTALVEDQTLLERAQTTWQKNPVRVPTLDLEAQHKSATRRAIVTTMKNEGPFILEWLAYHRAIGFDDFLIYTNDCTDGTDTMLQLLQDEGLVQHRENPFHGTSLKPQHAALHAARKEPLIKDAAWVTCIDVDEFVNIKCGDGTLNALFDHVPDANMIAMTWRLFGNADVHAYKDTPITEQFTRCAAEYARKPHQAWGFKTLFRNIGLFKKLGVHRPKGLNPQLWEHINWVNGSGARLPVKMYRNSWRSTSDTYGYDLVQLNHYAVRSAESFLVKRDRGRVNHVDRDQGLNYWFRMNNNDMPDDSIERMLPRLRAELDKLMSNPKIAAAHAHSVQAHRNKIAELKATPNYAAFYETLTGPEMEKLSRLHRHFGASVFRTGPDGIPTHLLDKDPDEDWFYTFTPDKSIDG